MKNEDLINRLCPSLGGSDDLPIIIGLSGKIGSGKDLAYTIIEYAAKGIVLTVDNYKEYQSKLKESQDNAFIHLKFADKIKNVLCLILNCTREDLEDRNFKEKPLDFLQSYMSLDITQLYENKAKTIQKKIGFKDTKHLITTEDYSNLVTSVKDFIPNIKYCTTLIENPTPRYMLQTLGADWGRNIHPDLWVWSTLNTVNPDKQYIITDVRYPNEVKAIEDLGGVVIRLRSNKTLSIDEHESETALDKYKFEHVIDNDYTFNNFRDKLYETIEKLII